MKKKYHLIGIKGAGMSALALILHDLGYKVQGSDVEEKVFTQIELEAKGISLYPFGKSSIEANMEVIVGNAFNDDHPEIVEAKSKGAKMIRYHDFLGELIRDFTSIAVGGTHGKTTTTGLLAHVLRLNYPTSYLIGDGTGKGVKGSKYFAFEACEYKRHFLSYQPDYGIITNIEHDHPDYFKDTDDVIDAFNDFASQCKQQVIACGDDPRVKKLKNFANMMTYGFDEGNQIVAKNVLKSADGTTFDVIINKVFYHTFKTPFFGAHMVLNSLSVIAICYLEGLAAPVIEKDLSIFTGVKRRFTEKECHDQIIIDDYAHHPTEIEVTLKAVRQKYPNKKIVAIFQPHTFTRTETFIDEFSESLSLADAVYLTEIFGSAREAASDIKIEMLIGKCKNGQLITEGTVNQLSQYPEAVLVFMGAGDIKKYEDAYLKQYKINHNRLRRDKK